MKNCNKCKNIKPLNEFHRRAVAIDGRMTICKICHKSDKHIYRKNNLEKIKATDALYRKNNLEKVRASTALWRKNNPEKAKAIRTSYRKNNLNKVRARVALWSKNNPAKCNTFTAKRRAAKLQRTPKWLTSLHYEQIELFYDVAAKLSIEFSIKMEVDHIVPLQGDNVSGLHVPWNLQVISRAENRVKSNKLA